jgi:hypothetical protein
MENEYVFAFIVAALRHVFDGVALGAEEVGAEALEAMSAVLSGEKSPINRR